MKEKLNTWGKKVIIALFKKKKKDRFAHDQEGDWEKILISFGLIMCIIIGVHVFFFYKLKEGDLFKGKMIETQTPPVFNQNLMKQYNEYYDARAYHFSSLQDAALATSSALIDPSL